MALASTISLLTLKYLRSVRLSGSLICITSYVALTIIVLRTSNVALHIAHTAILVQLFVFIFGLRGMLFVACGSTLLTFIISKTPSQDDIHVLSLFFHFIAWFCIFYWLNELTHRQLQTSLQNANKHKTDFVARMSHELRTPLFGIVGCLEMIEHRVDSDQKAVIEIAQTCCKNLMGLIDDILDLSKIEAGHVELDMKLVNIASVIDDSIKVITNQARKKNITITKVVRENLPKFFLGDLTRLKQVIINLLINAVKFTPESGFIRFSVAHVDRVVEPFAKYVFSPRSNPVELQYPQNGYLQFSVTDNGIGLEKQEMVKVFNAFEQADVSTSRRFGGSGLGLTISHHLVTQMGGEFVVFSDGNRKGSTFQFTIPNYQQFQTLPKLSAATSISQSEPTLIKYKRKKKPKKEDVIDQYRSTSTGKLHINEKEEVISSIYPLKDKVVGNLSDTTLNESTILVVEDNKINQTILKRMLERLGYKSDIAEDGKVAIKLLQKRRDYELIFMDLEMPILDGISCTMILRSELKIDIPIVALSAHALMELKKQTLEAGMDDFVTKPVNSETLKGVLKKWVGMRRAM